MAFLSKKVQNYRLDLMRAFMDRHELDALAFLTPDYFFYATNYLLDVAPWERPVIAIVPRTGDPVMVLNELSTNHLTFTRERKSLWVDDVTLYSEHPRLSDRLYLTPQVPELFAERLRAGGRAGGRPDRRRCADRAATPRRATPRHRHRRAAGAGDARAALGQAR